MVSIIHGYEVNSSNECNYSNQLQINLSFN